MSEPIPSPDHKPTQPNPVMSRRHALGSVALCGAAVNMALSNDQTVIEKNRINPRLYTFVGGNTGPWTITQFKTVTGEPLPEPAKLNILNAYSTELPAGAKWMLRGVTSNARYVQLQEKQQLEAKQAPLGRTEATCGALIPIRKKAEWWGLTQDERRAIFEERSHHTAIGLKYLPAIARRLHHCRDLALSEPFDFLTLFDYAEADAAAFEELVGALRATEEWKYVDWEIDIRFVHA
jgi:Chlorite dismutase